MGSLFKPTYTDKKTGERRKAKKWYGQFVDALGMTHRKPLSANKAAARTMLNDIEDRVEREKSGRLDPHEEHRRVALVAHLKAYRQSFADRGHTDRQSEQVCTRCRAVFDGIGAVFLADLNAEAVAEWLTAKRAKAKKDGGIGAQTSNHYVAAVKAFGNWCVKTRRVAANPFQHLSKVNVEVDIRHQRRDLSAEELNALVNAARVGKLFRRLTGLDRAMLYTVAGYTGLRASELASLTPESFDLDAGIVTVDAAYSKHRRTDTLPVHPDLTALLRPWLADRSRGARLWPGKWAANCEAVDLMKKDLAAARAKWIKDATSAEEREQRERSDYLAYRDESGRVADFHSLRHTFITRIVRAGVAPKDAMELARHSTITLTMDRYAHVGLRDMAAALNKLDGPTPEPQPETLRATGTDPACTAACTKLAQTAGSGRLRLTTIEESEGEGEGNATASGEGVLREIGDSREKLKKVHLEGFEPSTFGSVDPKTICVNTSTPTDSGQTPTPLALQLAHRVENDPDFARFADLWPTLPDAIKRAILALVNAVD